MNEEQRWDKYMQFDKEYPLAESTYFVDFANLGVMFMEWLKTKNPDYLDHVVATLSHNEIPIKGVLLSEVGALAASRLIREKFTERSIRSNANKTFRREYDYKCFMLILKLIVWCDMPLYKACEQVAQWRDKQDSNLSFRKKVSTLEKEFSSWKKQYPKEEELIRNPSKFTFCYNYRNWTEEEKKYVSISLLGEEFGELPEHLRGERR